MKFSFQKFKNKISCNTSNNKEYLCVKLMWKSPSLTPHGSTCMPCGNLWQDTSFKPFNIAKHVVVSVKRKPTLCSDRAEWHQVERSRIGGRVGSTFARRRCSTVTPWRKPQPIEGGGWVGKGHRLTPRPQLRRLAQSILWTPAVSNQLKIHWQTWAKVTSLQGEGDLTH